MKRESAKIDAVINPFFFSMEAQSYASEKELVRVECRFHLISAMYANQDMPIEFTGLNDLVL